MRRSVVSLVIVLLWCVPSAWAGPIHDAAASPQYGRKFGGMIGRGLLNVTTCFVDVIVGVVEKTKAGPPVVGTLVGVAQGVGCGALRAGSGVVDLVTFWVPGFNGIPVQATYGNCLAQDGSDPHARALRAAPRAPAFQMSTPTQLPPEGVEPTGTEAQGQAEQKRTWYKK